MEKIRRSTKKHGKLLIVIVALIALGLVVSFATWGSGSGGSGNADDMTNAEKIEQYEKYLNKNEPAADAEIDFSTASSMAGMYSDLGGFYNTAIGEATEDTVKADYVAKMIAAYEKAVNYYQMQMDKMPDTLTDAGIANLYASFGRLYYTAAQTISTYDADAAAPYQEKIQPTYQLAVDYYNQQLTTSLETMTGKAIGNMYMELGSLCSAAAQSINSIDATAAEAWLEQMRAAYGEAIGYFQAELDENAENMEDSDKALIYANMAYSMGNTDTPEEAKALYQQALSIEATNLSIAISYLSYLYTYEGLEAATAYGEEYCALVGGEGDDYDYMQYQMMLIQLVDQMSNGDSGTDGGDDQTPVEGEEDADGNGEDETPEEEQ